MVEDLCRGAIRFISLSAAIMKLDYLAQRPMEIEYMYEKPLARAAEAGCDMKNIRILTEELHSIQKGFRELTL